MCNLGGGPGEICTALHISRKSDWVAIEPPEIGVPVDPAVTWSKPHLARWEPDNCKKRQGCGKRNGQ